MRARTSYIHKSSPAFSSIHPSNRLHNKREVHSHGGRPVLTEPLHLGKRCFWKVACLHMHHEEAYCTAERIVLQHDGAFGNVSQAMYYHVSLPLQAKSTS
ncbi:hypothetical protein M3J09_004954 [Ascochyta lentis]